MVTFPYHSHFRIPKDMGMVWEDYHKGVPLLGVPEITELGASFFPPSAGWCHLCQGLNSHYFHILGDGHQPNSRGLYTHYKDSY